MRGLMGSLLGWRDGALLPDEWKGACDQKDAREKNLVITPRLDAAIHQLKKPR